MWKKLVFGIIGTLAAFALTVKLGNLDKNPRFLDFFAQAYFDEQYYLETYPDVKDSGMDPFVHFMQIGWKENKNPSARIDIRFYKNINYEWQKYNLTPLQHLIRSNLALKMPWLNPSEVKRAEPLQDPEYELALVTVFRNEAPYLKEWIEYYRMMGVDHMILYNHLSTDNFQEVLAPYIKEGYVELRHLTYEPPNNDEWIALQCRAYTEATYDLAPKAEWLIALDTDEYFLPMHDKDLKTALRRYNDHAAVSPVWQMFGSGNVESVPEDRLMIESLVASEGKLDQHGHVKSIVKPRYVDRIVNPHYPHLKSGYAQVNDNFQYFKGPFNPEPSSTYIRINHYWARDWNFFRNTKIRRVHVIGHEMAPEAKQQKIESLIATNESYSVKQDDTILKYVSELRERVGLS